MKSDIAPTNTGLDLVRRMVGAHERKKRADQEANSASCEVANSENELVKWLVPKGAKAGDVFVLPVGKRFVQVRMIECARLTGGYESNTSLEAVVEWRDGDRPSLRELD